MNALQDKRFAVIGASNIGRILLGRLMGAGVPGRQISVIDAQPERELAAAVALGVQRGSLSEMIISAADILLLTAPPQFIMDILMTVRDWLHSEQLVVSFAAAVPLNRIEAIVPLGVAVARVMPNAPSLIGQGMNPVAYGQAVSVSSRAIVERLLAVLGKSFEVRDDQMNWCVGLSGAAMRSLLPVLEGMTQAGVVAGLQVETARRAAAQVMLGTAALALRTSMKFDEIKSLTPMQTIDEKMVSDLFLDAAYGTKEKIDRLEMRLWEAPERSP